MNYGKSAYLKVMELEKRISSSNNLDEYASKFLEFNKTELNQSLYNGQSVKIDFPFISLEAGKDVCFQIKITLTSQNSDTLLSSIYLNNICIHDEQSSLKEATNEIILLKTFSPLSSSNHDLSLKFSGESDANIITISNIKVIVMGLTNVSSQDSIEMRALKVQNNVLISFIESNTLYYAISSLDAKTIDSKEFSALDQAISHCFFTKSSTSAMSDVLLGVVDQNNKLYVKTPFKMGTDKLVDENVSFVDCKMIDNQSDENSMIAYIKDNDIYYTTFRKDSMLTPRKLSISNQKFKEVHIATIENCDDVYIIATDMSGSNYIVKSVVDAESGKITDLLQTNFYLALSKYIDLSICDNNAIENLNMNFSMIANPYTIYDKFIERKCVDNLKASFNFTNQTYIQPKTIVYGVKLNKSDPSLEWASYTDDAIGLQGAYMDFENDVFVSNGWENRWPYSEIKPCVIKDSQIVGYLDKNDYSKFADGTDFENTNPDNGKIVVEFPKIYYKLSADENYNYVQISDTALDGFCCLANVYKGEELDHIYVDAYMGPDASVYTLGARTFSGMKLQETYISSYGRTYPALKLMGERWEPMNFNVHTLICALFAVMFKSTSCETKLGKGFLFNKVHYLGETDKKGMFYGTQEAGHIKLFGLEDYYGARSTLCSGVYIDSSSRYNAIDPYDPTQGYATSQLKKFSLVEKEYKLPDTQATIAISINGVNELGFLPTIDNNTVEKNKGFCDLSKGLINSTLIYVGKPILINDGGGLFSVYLYTTTNTAQTSIRGIFFPEKLGGTNEI